MEKTLADTIILKSWKELVNQLEKPSTGNTIRLEFSEDNCEPALVIHDVFDIKIIGRGVGRTKVHIDRDVSDCIRIGDNVRGLEISGFSLLGAIGKENAPNNGNAPLEHAEANKFGPKNPGEGCDRLVHRGITSSKWKCILEDDDQSIAAKSISSVTIKDMEIAFLTSAIGLQGTKTHPMQQLVIERNHIHHIRGTASGVGYGIQLSWVPGAKILNNTLFRVGRHSIYVGLGGIVESDRIIIKGNKIEDGGIDSGNAMLQTCIAIARTAFVTAESNSVRRCYAHALSVERDEAGRRIIPRGILLKNNTFSRRQVNRSDIWIDLDDSPRHAVTSIGNNADGKYPATYIGNRLDYFVHMQ